MVPSNLSSPFHGVGMRLLEPAGTDSRPVHDIDRPACGQPGNRDGMVGAHRLIVNLRAAIGGAYPKHMFLFWVFGVMSAGKGDCRGRERGAWSRRDQGRGEGAGRGRRSRARGSRARGGGARGSRARGSGARGGGAGALVFMGTDIKLRPLGSRFSVKICA